MKKSELRKIIREEIQNLEEAGMFKHGKLYKISVFEYDEDRNRYPDKAIWNVSFEKPSFTNADKRAVDNLANQLARSGKRK